MKSWLEAESKLISAADDYHKAWSRYNSAVEIRDCALMSLALRDASAASTDSAAALLELAKFWESQS